MANLEQSGSRIPDAQSIKLIFSLTVTFYLTKTENRIQISLTQLSHIALSKGTFFTKKMLKCADISKIRRTLCFLSGRSSSITYSYETDYFQHGTIILTGITCKIIPL